MFLVKYKRLLSKSTCRAYGALTGIASEFYKHTAPDGAENADSFHRQKDVAVGTKRFLTNPDKFDKGIIYTKKFRDVNFKIVEKPVFLLEP